MNTKDINAKWQAEINKWVAYDKTHQSTSEEHKITRDKVFNGKAKWWYDPYDTSWNVMTNDDIPVEVGQRYIYIGETYKMKKVKPYKDEEETNKMQMIQMKVGETLAQNENGTWTIVPKRTPISKRVGKVALVLVAVLGLGSGIVGITSAGAANERADKIDAKITQMQKQEDSTNKSIQLLVESTNKLGNTSTQDAEWMKAQVDDINAKLVELGK
ncbi:hypothetical protein LaP1706_gp46 [Lactococcus phage 1706]|uniref:Uncharacterized protein n=1 Tax=Lactococcus phage 1706 TaxID=475178 RepID=B2BTL0_9CAUD|nr:hypothetical protein LaP1706_gp46 [Lactococcus phage 1706]ABV91253.1 unknown [Lactococcus phage 1706]